MILLLLPLVSAGCKKQADDRAAMSMMLMDTVVEIGVRGCGPKQINAAFESMRKVESKLNRFDPSSELSRINSSAGTGPVKASADLFEVVGVALDVAQATGGAFDPTVSPAVELWASQCCKPPELWEIEDVAARIGWEKIELHKDGKISIPEGVSLNLDGIAKGYAVDKALETLKRGGCAAAIVNAGGDVACYAAQNERPWSIGIEGTGSLKISIRNGAVATSGTERRFKIIDGKKYSHVIDPRSSTPVDGRIISATAVTTRCLSADAWATAALVAAENILDSADDFGVGIVLLDSHNKIKSNKYWNIFNRDY